MSKIEKLPVLISFVSIRIILEQIVFEFFQFLLPLELHTYFSYDLLKVSWSCAAIEILKVFFYCYSFDI